MLYSEPGETEDLTRKAVDKLVDSPEFKKYMLEKEDRVMNKFRDERPIEGEVEDEGKESENTEAVIEELQEMEEKIFDLWDIFCNNQSIGAQENNS